jgi:hypothetical protein
MPTRVKSGQASHHSARKGFPSKYKGDPEAGGSKKGSKGERVQTPACICVNKQTPCLYVY